MKYSIMCLLLFFSAVVLSQEKYSTDEVEKVCFGYIEGFYEGDADKLKKVLSPTLHKFGYWLGKTGEYSDPIYMTFEGALEYADEVKSEKKFAKEGSPKKVVVMDVMDKIAVAKVTAWWGYDYILLSKVDGRWLIQEVIWQGPFIADVE